MGPNAVPAAMVKDGSGPSKQVSCGSTASTVPGPDSCDPSSAHEDSSDPCFSDSSEPETPEPDAPVPATAAVRNDVAASLPQKPGSRLVAAGLRLLHLLIFASCIAATRVLLTLRSLLALVVRGAEPRRQLLRPGSRLSWELLSGSEDPVRAVREALPVPPPFPEPPVEGLTISFGPCANLMIYTGGVAACLQRCPNYAEVSPRLRFYGVSCGAFLAAVLAADCELIEMLPEMLAWTAKYRGRLWGMIGAYSASVARIVRWLFTEASGGAPALRRFERARERLGIAVTAFTPGPQRVPVERFADSKELMTTLLGSCYIPVAFEEPQWSPSLGPLWDGGILEFATHGDVVFSPYEACCPDVHPATPYPRSLTFFPPHECDAVQLFEDGYMDCLRWLEAGAPTRTAARQELTATGSGFKPLFEEGCRFLGDVLGWRNQRQPQDISSKAGHRD